MEETDSFDLPVQKRLWTIEKNWEKFTAFQERAEEYRTI